MYSLSLLYDQEKNKSRCALRVLTFYEGHFYYISFRKKNKTRFLFLKNKGINNWQALNLNTDVYKERLHKYAIPWYHRRCLPCFHL